MKNTVLGMVLLVGMGCGGGGPKASASPAPTRESAQAAYERHEWRECSKQYRQLAGARAWQRGANEYSAACCDARGGRPDAAFAMLTRATKDGYHDAAWAAKDADLETLRGDARWAPYLEAAKLAQAAEEKTLHQDLVDDLAARVKVDQDARNSIIEAQRDGSNHPELWVSRGGLYDQAWGGKDDHARGGQGAHDRGGQTDHVAG